MTDPGTEKPADLHFFIDLNRCLGGGCQACLQACSECDTHNGESMIHLEFIDRSNSVQTVAEHVLQHATCAVLTARKPE